MVTRLEHVPSTSNIAESRCASEASFSVFGTFSTGPKRATPAQRVRELMNLLLDLVRSEWEAIRALNLGKHWCTPCTPDAMHAAMHI